MRYPDHLMKLIALFKKFPGVGSRSAERFAFQLLEWPELKIGEMAEALLQVKERLQTCPECGALTENNCSICHSERNTSLCCVVASQKDIFLIEQTQEFKGIYHVIGGLLSPLQGHSLKSNAIKKLKNRCQALEVKEMILALDSTLEGDATALYLKKELESLNIITSRLALGLPMGSSLDYIDGGTLARALAGRHQW